MPRIRIEIDVPENCRGCNWLNEKDRFFSDIATCIVKKSIKTMNDANTVRSLIMWAPNAKVSGGRLLGRPL